MTSLAQALQRRRAAPRLQDGFTLVELLVVLVILALLFGLVVPRTIDYLGRAKSDVAMRQMCLGRFDALSEIERDALSSEFESTLAAPFRKFYRDQGLANKLVNAEWESFLARKFGPGAE